MTENDNDRVRTPDVYAERQRRLLQLSQNSISARIAVELILERTLCEPLMTFYYAERSAGVCQGPQIDPSSSKVGSCAPCPPYIGASDPASNIASTERREECSTSSDKKLLTRWTHLLQGDEEAATKDEDRAGKDGSAPQGVARTVLRLLANNDGRSDASDDEQ